MDAHPLSRAIFRCRIRASSELESLLGLSVGRYYQPEPELENPRYATRMSEESYGLPVYAYVADNPVVYTDPTGCTRSALVPNVKISMRPFVKLETRQDAMIRTSVILKMLAAPSCKSALVVVTSAPSWAPE